jgi:hypothetical protein
VTARAPLVAEPAAAAPSRGTAARAARKPAARHAGRAGGSELGAIARSRMLPLQAKLEVGAVDDPLEHEAERIAREVMRMPASGGSPARCACGGTPGPDGECAACRAKRLARVAVGSAAPVPREAPPSVDAALAGPGRSLDPSTRTFFESRLGHDLGAVRVHDDARAHASARDVAAHAYTVGRDIVFSEGMYRPRSDAGRALLGHELAHVMQQRAARPRLQRQPAPTGAIVSTAAAEGGVNVTIKAATSLSGREVFVLTVMAARRVTWEKAVKLVESQADVGCVHPACQTGLGAGETLEVFFGPPRGASGAGQGEQAQAKKRLPVEVRTALDNRALQEFIRVATWKKQIELPNQDPATVDYPAVVSVRDSLLRLTPDDLRCYRDWMKQRPVPKGWTEIARSLAAFREVRADFCTPVELEPLTPLAGTEHIYALIKEFERVDKLPKSFKGEPNEQVRELVAKTRVARDKALQDLGFESVDAFDRAANAFRLYFRKHAVTAFEHAMGESRQILSDARTRYQVGQDPYIQPRFQVPAAAHDLWDEVHAIGGRTGEQLYDAHPILRGRGAREALSRSTSAYEMTTRLGTYIGERLRDLRFVEGHVRRDPDVVFKFDPIVEKTMERMGLVADSVHASVIRDQRGKPSGSIVSKVVDVALLLLSFVPGPIGITAGLVSGAREVAGQGIKYEAGMMQAEENLRERPSAAPILYAVASNVAPPVITAGAGKVWGVVKGTRRAAQVGETTGVAGKAVSEAEQTAAAKAHVPPSTAPEPPLPPGAPTPEAPKIAAPEPEVPKARVTEAEPPKTPTPEPEPRKTGTPEPEPPKTATPEPEPPKTPRSEPEPPKRPTPEPEPRKAGPPEPEPPKTLAPEPETEIYPRRVARARTRLSNAADEATEAAKRATTAADRAGAATEAELLASRAVARARQEAAVLARQRDAAELAWQNAPKGQRRAPRKEFTKAKNAAQELQDEVARMEKRARQATKAREAAEQTATRQKDVAAAKAVERELAEKRLREVEQAVAESKAPRLEPGEPFSMEKRRPNLGATGPEAATARGVPGEFPPDSVVRIYKRPFATEAQLARQREILELAKTNPQQAGNRYSQLTGEAHGWTDVAEMTTYKRGAIGRRPDFGNRVKEATIEGRADKLGDGKLDQLWEDLKLGLELKTVPVIDLTVPTLSTAAEKQLARLAAEWKSRTGIDPLILVRETAP